MAGDLYTPRASASSEYRTFGLPELLRASSQKHNFTDVTETSAFLWNGWIFSATAALTASVPVKQTINSKRWDLSSTHLAVCLWPQRSCSRRCGKLVPSLPVWCSETSPAGLRVSVKEPNCAFGSNKWCISAAVKILYWNHLPWSNDSWTLKHCWSGWALKTDSSPYD